eukprot:4115629-Prymnesium_polylepis.1
MKSDCFTFLGRHNATVSLQNQQCSQGDINRRNGHSARRARRTATTACHSARCSPLRAWTVPRRAQVRRGARGGPARRRRHLVVGRRARHLRGVLAATEAALDKERAEIASSLPIRLQMLKVVRFVTMHALACL